MKNILIAPLNWGLGHASRCIPIIRFLQKNHKVIIATDGIALQLLKNEFPTFTFIELPGYEITYTNKRNFLWHLIKQIPFVLRTVRKENKICKTICNEHKIDLILSDNRYGMYNAKTPSLFLTHQLNILIDRKWTFPFSLHQLFLKRFSKILVPDYADNQLAGKLSRLNKRNLWIEYIGLLSKFESNIISTDTTNDILVILSGPEPSRSNLEKELFRVLSDSKYRIVLIRGSKMNCEVKADNILTIDLADQKEMELWIQKSRLIICRSGYSSIMDLLALNKKAILIPTPQQMEQEYLASIHHLNPLFVSIEEKNIKKQLINSIRELLKKKNQNDRFYPVEFEHKLNSYLQS
ncbi:MAG TPA: glycosyltransferase [Bacteroidia bacterium]|nr:glycosyltransferase [Bacteroidia bacterium]